jgi:NAD(P)-dependent dehydrogenase (short-subunit alcohol dehydrogenase family)
LVNNAANYETVEFDKITSRQWDAMFASNTRGPFLVSREALKFLRARRGKIINMGSLGGLQAWATHAHYCSSKAALHMLTKVMAKALAPEIAVNCVAPGMIDLGEKAAAAFMKRMAKETPMRRNGAAEDVAAAVLFFATAPHFITGQVMAVDGGLGL